MSMSNIKALCFDTGGTILDWHTGMRTALAAVGARHGVERDWAKLANEFRRRSLKLIVNHGEHAPATMTFDDAHRDALDQVLADNGLGVFSEQERRTLWWDAIHGLKCWPDFPDSLARLRGKFMCVSFTLLSFRIIMDTARRNGISWDAVISCEAIGKYKILPEAYKTCARFLQLAQDIFVHGITSSEIGSTFHGSIGPCQAPQSIPFRPTAWEHEVPERFSGPYPDAYWVGNNFCSRPWRSACFHCRTRVVYHGPILLGTV